MFKNAMFSQKPVQGEKTKPQKEEATQQPLTISVV